MTAYHVKIHNLGRAAKVIHDGQKPIRIDAGGTTETILTEDTIKRLKAEHVDPEEPRLEIEQGAKAEEEAMHNPAPPPEGQHAASGEENHGDAPASHKPRAGHK